MIADNNFLFELTGGRMAVFANSKKISHAELADKSDAVAHHLRGLNIGQGDLVLIYMGRDVEMVVALIGVLKSGAAYTIIEVENDSRSMLTRLASITYTTVLTTIEHISHLKSANVLTILIEEAQNCLKKTPLPIIKDSDAAYVLYTSGSTGTPKGVKITHGNIRHYVGSLIAHLNISTPLNYAHVSTFDADLGNTGLFLSLMTGGTLHILDDDTRKDHFEFFRYLSSHKIDCVKMTPSHWGVMFDGARQNDIRTIPLQYLILGGEALSIQLAKNTLEAGATRTLVNHYGPTETTIGVLLNVITDPKILVSTTTKTVPVGRPLGKTRILVKIRANEYRDAAAEGELYIGGPSVAAGYINDDQTTASKFVSGIEGEAIFYKSGDSVRIDEDGVVEFLGRIDRQLKINGYRVELDHVENVIRKAIHVENVFASVVNIKGHDYLVAALLASNEEQPLDVVKDLLRRELPRYMVPHLLVKFSTFPLTANGKVNTRLLAQQVRAEVISLGNSENSIAEMASNQVVTDILSVWEKYLIGSISSINDNFFDLGGDSITAIQVIADLQKKGYRISANTFLKDATVSAIADAIRHSNSFTEATSEPVVSSKILSPIQKKFFAQEYPQVNHWSQAILLQCESHIDPVVFEASVCEVVALHPLLRTKYFRPHGSWEAELVDSVGGSFTSSRLGDVDEEEVNKHIYSVSEDLYKSIDISTGRVFKCHLFRLDNRPSQILLECHHLSIDTVSWRIVVSDLMSTYSARMLGSTASTPRMTNTFWNWVQHIEKNSDVFRQNEQYWKEAIRGRSHNLRSYAGENTERMSKSVWIALSTRETEVLTKELGKQMGVNLSTILLGAFSYIFARARNIDAVYFEYESHGRLSLDDRLDVSRVVGWFTSAFPLLLEVDSSGIVDNIRKTHELIGGVPQLGIGYGLMKDESSLPEPQRSPQLCYNFLGEFNFNVDADLCLSPSRYRISPARGERNDRVHDLKLTAKVLDGQLIVDLGFPVQSYDVGWMVAIFRELKGSLLNLISSNPSVVNDDTVVIDEGSTTGLITYAPRELNLNFRQSSAKNYSEIFLTGATGYIGIHLLRGLLERTKAHIHCLVRAKNGLSPWERLFINYGWYFKNCSLEQYRHRITVIEGDIGQENFGISPDRFNELCASIDAIYHLAADTNLLKDSDHTEKQNVGAVTSAIKMASSIKAKDLHYTSTLAVSGINQGPQTVIFSERCLDIGQRFQNSYELNKFKAEVLIQEFISAGGSGFIYRAGNVSGHSQTGRFQINAEENRFVQFLRAVITVGKIPQEMDYSITFTSVDAVANAILTLSLSRIDRRVYHVDELSQFKFDVIFNSLKDIGIDLEISDETSFKDIFRNSNRIRDPVVAIGEFWANREEKNVLYDHSNTHTILKRHGYSFKPLDENWLKKYLEDLVERKVLATGISS